MDGGCSSAVVGMVVLLLLMLDMVAVVEGDGGGRLGSSLVLAAVVVVVILGRNGYRCGLSWRRRWGRRWERRLRGRSGWRRGDRLAIQTQVFVFLAEPVQLDLQLLDSTPLGFQKLLLTLDDVVEFKKVLHGPVRAFRIALARALISIHDKLM